MSKIEWTNKTWNPTVGCSKVSAGCQNCYAIKDQYRMAKNPNSKISSVSSGLTEKRGNRLEWTGQVKFLPARLEQPLHWCKPRMVFVNSQSDLFHESITDEELDQIFAVMALTPQHTYQVLTKRPKRMYDYCKSLGKHNTEDRLSKAIAKINPNGSAWYEMRGGWCLPNLWLGVTVENQQTANERIPLLLQTPAAIRFLSCEPLLERVDLRQVGQGAEIWDSLNGQFLKDDYSLDVCPTLDWVIVGGESGHNARPCDIDWIESIVTQCVEANISCFVKQLGSNAVAQKEWAVINGASLSMVGSKYSLPNITGKGSNPDEWPASLRVRQFPKTKTHV